MIKSRRMRWAWYVARMEANRNAHWWESQKERDHLEDKMDPKEAGWGVLDWIDLAQDRD
jgi:hypothetical protein